MYSKWSGYTAFWDHTTMGLHLSYAGVVSNSSAAVHPALQKMEDLGMRLLQ